MPHFCEQLTRFFTGRQPVATDPSTSVHDANQMAPSQSRTHGTTARSMRLAYPGAQLRTPLDHQRLGDHRQAESRPHRMRPNASLRNTASTQTEAAALRESLTGCLALTWIFCRLRRWRALKTDCSPSQRTYQHWKPSTARMRSMPTAPNL